MADELAYERGVSPASNEIWRIEAELKTAHGPLLKTWYVGTWPEARELAAYPAQQGGRLVGMDCFERKRRG